MSFMKMGAVNAVLSLKVSVNLYPKIPHCWLKFAMRDVHVMLWGSSECHENWYRGGHTFLVGVNEITLMRCDTVSDFESKECLDVVCVLSHGMRFVQ
jgi:hypothetical protein